MEPTTAGREVPFEVSAQVADALERTVEEVRAAEIDPLAGPAVDGIATVGIWRVRGADWSAVVKVLRHVVHGGLSVWRSEDDPAHPFHWRREADAFADGLLGSLPGDLRAPACYGVVPGPDGTLAIWMEDVAGCEGSTWALPRYRQAAEHLGQVQGHLAREHLAGEPVLDRPWMSRGWLRTYVDRRAARSAADADPTDPRVWSPPLVRRLVPADRVPAFQALWAARHRLLDVVDGLPRTLCQLDFHPRNLFDVAGRTVVIDWAFAGVGALGEDLGNLVVDAVTDFHLPPSKLPELFETLVAGYADGLAAAGWSGSDGPAEPAEVRRMVAAGAAAKYGWLAPAIPAVVAQGRTTLNGRPIEEAAPLWVACGDFLVELADLAVRGGPLDRP
ncbi:phosphotransferase [Actinopolymorpha singaporensis]|uniref:Phosphotransferase enzyme family protein n=1 Tax=Actinopolymorpha singaporensis TaxID=117157 RepID=A0A1H1YXH1_9ACTN|nr:phosphotransferase [Actinopolymorpha singaporensis]SDT26245.1 Phosphotransferase enzyme family protein [Actinopolymorpha singaporensis]